MAENGKRLIEVTLPLAAISAQLARERSFRHDEICGLHGHQHSLTSELLLQE